MTTERIVDDISYTLKRNRGQKSLRLHLSPEGHVIVTAPCFVSFNEIDAFVRSSSSWINEHAGKIASHDYKTGDFVPYLGKKMTLMVITGRMAQYDIIDDKIIVTVKIQDIESIRKAIKQLYVDTIGNRLETRVPFWCKAIGVPVPAYGVNRAKGKWGVCYPQEKRLYLSYMCATLPEDLIDMTILHEVCHLRYSGHGKDFWNLMKSNMPDLDKRKAELGRITKSGWVMNIV